MITDNETPANVIARAGQVLWDLHNALEEVKTFQQYLSGVALADLEDASAGLGFSAAYAQGLKSAFADGDAVRQIVETGLPPSSYPQPPAAYVYGASMYQIMGPGQAGQRGF